MSKLKIGVIGCGRISVVYQEALQRLEKTASVRMAVDKDPDRARAFASHFDGCASSDKIGDLLDCDLDVVHVLTPHFLHKEHVIACLRAGFHVLTEKPIAIYPEDASAMAEAARQSGKQLGVIFQNRYIEGIQAAKRAMTDGSLGKATGAWSTLNWWRPPSYYECDWKGKWETEGGGVVIDQAIHSLDLVRYLIGCEVQSIQGHIDNRVLKNIEVEDVADAAITFENGAVYSFFACNYYTYNSPIRLEISCENGRIRLMENNVVSITCGDREHTVMPAADPFSRGEKYWGNYHYYQIKDYYEKLCEGKPVPVDPLDAKKTLEMVQGIYRSSREGGPVRLSRPSAIL